MIDDHYRAIVESAEDPIFICDPDGRYLYGNHRAAANLGLTPEQFAGKSVDELFPPEAAAAFRAGVRQVVESGETLRSEDHLVLGDGAEFWSSTLMQPLRDASGRITAVQGIVRDIASRKRAEIALQKSEERLRQVIRASQIGIFDLNFDAKSVYWSAEQRTIWGWGADDVIAWDEHLAHIHPDDIIKITTASEQAHRHPDGVFELEHRITRRDGVRRWLIVRAQAFFVENGDKRRLVRVVGATRDITDEKLAAAERTELQDRLVQSQKLESVGRLAGGIAHDFNNILNIIIGCAEMASSEADPSAVSGYLAEILKAATRSADLTRQLLGFARRQTVMPRVVDLNDFVSASLKMLRRLIGEHVTLSWHPGGDVWPVRIDPVQVDQILVNLVANARDAIGEAGSVVIHSENVPLSSNFMYPGLQSGEYVRLAVVDDGKGMDPETQSHLFEPFYTTKPAGHGTGLGMASVDGIVRQNGGLITVSSAVGRGTTVNVLLPRVVTLPAAVGIGHTEALRGGTETILLVEDEPALLRLATRSLESLGYTVLSASRPDDALVMAREHRGPLHMLLTDVVMPGMNGRKLADRLLEDTPNLKCLFMSGYTDGIMGKGGVLEEDVHFLQKPFSPKSLADKVRKVLEE
ncbi:MAG TPA: PAS domain S-box protein [Vicinamibacterales bacterium]|nr:PAS domain S-box protein [Vicinamibacterales bacterium]